MTRDAARHRATVDRLYERAVAGAKDEIGGARAFMIQGPVVRRALVRSELLRLLYAQDATVTDAAVRTLLDDLMAKVLEDDQTFDD